MERHGCDECNRSNEDKHERVVTVTLGFERIVSEFVAERLIVSVWLIHNQVSVGVWGENVLMTAIETW